MLYNEIMVDIESTGSDPSHSAIIQISAVRFNLEERQVDAEHMFDRCLQIPNNRFWQEDTRDWWASQDPKIFHDIMSRAEEPRQVMHDFYNFAKGTVMWGKPISFEFPFLQSYFKEYVGAMPFHYSECQDLRSWCRARGHWKLDRELPFDGDAHNALHDVLHQLKVLFTLLEMA